MARPHRFRMYHLKLTMAFANNESSKSRPFVRHPALLPHMPAYKFNSICDIQEKFRPAIFEYGKV